MSLIAEALRKAEKSSSESSPGAPRPQGPIWAYRGILLSCVGIALLGLTQLARRPATASREHPAAVSAASGKTSGARLLRSARSNLALSGTIRGGDGKSLALINNEVLQEGDQIHGVRIVQVHPDSVEVQDRGGKTKTLKLEN